MAVRRTVFKKFNQQIQQKANRYRQNMSSVQDTGVQYDVHARFRLRAK